METIAQREAIRMNYDLGRQKGKAALAAVQTVEDLEIVKLDGSFSMDNSEGFDYSRAQGFWHVVSDEPRCLVEARRPKETVA